MLGDIVGCVVLIKGWNALKNGLKIRGYCAHTKGEEYSGAEKCRGYINLRSIKTTDEGHFKIKHTDTTIKHIKPTTRPLNFSARKSAKERMKSMYPEQYREHCLMNYDCKDITNAGPSKSQDVLKTVKSELYCQNDNSKDDIEDIYLEMVKDNSNSGKWIHRLSRHPFYVITQGKLQVDVLKAMRTRFPTNELTVCIDATGGLVRKPQTVTKALYYYGLVLPVYNTDLNEPSTPMALSDMVSSSHDIETISNWLLAVRIYFTKELNMWPIFNNIVTDFSFANLNSIMDIFNHMTITEYLNISYEWIHNRRAFRLEKNLTKVFLCCAHLMHIIKTDVTKIFKGAREGHIVNSFLLRS